MFLSTRCLDALRKRLSWRHPAVESVSMLNVVALCVVGVVCSVGCMLADWLGGNGPAGSVYWYLGIDVAVGVLLLCGALARTHFPAVLVCLTAGFSTWRIVFAWYALSAPPDGDTMLTLATIGPWLLAPIALSLLFAPLRPGLFIAVPTTVAATLLTLKAARGPTQLDPQFVQSLLVNEITAQWMVLLVVIGIAMTRQRVRRLHSTNETLNHEATTDFLTGLANRRRLLHRLERLLRRLTRSIGPAAVPAARPHRYRLSPGSRFAGPRAPASQMPEARASLVLLDLDHFKSVNDRFGHLAGDDVLIQLGQLLRSACGADDLACRWGGEEFAILSARSAVQAAGFAEDLRLRCARATWSVPVRLTASIGVTGIYPGDTVVDVFARADRALYGAKDGGRDRVEVMIPDDGDPAGVPVTTVPVRRPELASEALDA